MDIQVSCEACSADPTTCGDGNNFGGSCTCDPISDSLVQDDVKLIPAANAKVSVGCVDDCECCKTVCIQARACSVSAGCCVAILQLSVWQRRHTRYIDRSACSCRLLHAL